MFKRDFNLLLNTCEHSEDEHYYEDQENIIWIEWPSQLEDEQEVAEVLVSDKEVVQDEEAADEGFF